MHVHPVPIIPNTSPFASASGSTATAAIGQIVVMTMATSMSASHRDQHTRVTRHASRASS